MDAPDPRGSRAAPRARAARRAGPPRAAAGCAGAPRDAPRVLRRVPELVPARTTLRGGHHRGHRRGEPLAIRPVAVAADLAGAARIEGERGAAPGDRPRPPHARARSALAGSA